MSHITQDQLKVSTYSLLKELFNSDDSRPQVVASKLRIESYLDLCITQYFLNIEAAGPRWLERSTAVGQQQDRVYGRMPLDYRTAAFNEASAELFASACPYEWWRDPSRHKVDADNARMELVDVMHFLLSDTIRNEYESNEIENADSLAALKADPVNYCISVNEVAMSVLTAALTMERNMSIPRDLVVNDTMPAMEGLFQLRSTVLTLCSHLVHSRVGVSWSALMEVTRNLAVLQGEDPSVAPSYLISLYHGKVALNSFRWSHGMKEGKYQKVWMDEKEDNYYLQELLKAAVANGQMPSRAALTEWLEVNYELHRNQMAE